MKKIKKISLILGTLAIMVAGFSFVRAADETVRATTDKRPLEKIAHPNYIKDFEGIQRIDNALWGKRINSKATNIRCEEGTTRCGVSEQVKKTPEVRLFTKIETEAADCVKTAIETKDTNLKTALTVNNSSMITAIDSRTACQQAALDLTTATEQQTANQACVKTYHEAVANSLKALKTSKDNGWKTFRQDLKICGELQRAPASKDKKDILIEDGEPQINLEVSLKDDELVLSEIDKK